MKNRFNLIEGSRILVVDDIPENLQVLGFLLQNKGLEIDFAASGNEALDKIANHPPDLVLLDISMPEMDGFTVCKQIKDNQDTKEIPVIFVTAIDEMSHVVKGFEIGAVDYVTKPFNPSELLMRISTHLELKQSRDTITKKNDELEKLTEKLQNQTDQLKNEVAERIKIEKALRTSEQEFRQLNATKDKFFSIIAHDLKNSIANFLLSSTILVKHVDKLSVDMIKDKAESINSSALHLRKLLDNLLQWARAQTGQIQYTPNTIDLKLIVEDVIDVLAPSADIKNIELLSKIEKNTMTYIDQNMITTVLRNLITNAIKFTENGGQIRISCQKKDDLIDVVVIDTGIGIEEKNISKLFRIDMTYSTSGTAKEEGTGLGLVLCKEFVEKNGGEIWVESEIGNGSTFHFTIPQAPSNQQ